MKIICKELNIRLPRTKFKKWEKRYKSYSRLKIKPKKKRISVTRGLLRLLHKLNGLLDELEKDERLKMPERYYKRRTVIKEIYKQQQGLFDTGIPPKNRIVSISKSYLRPIVRGKEKKPVEFGAKVNKIQIDGINFIEHISFDAFHEGKRFINTVHYAQSLTHQKIKKIGAKPKDYKEKEQIRFEIQKERISRLEGSFGNEKEHYHLRKIKAKTPENEILWIFFGIHTANALEMGRRMSGVLEKSA